MDIFLNIIKYFKCKYFNHRDKLFYFKTKKVSLELEENINTNANWFQSMEPLTYAKKNGKKLYKFKKIKKISIIRILH